MMSSIENIKHDLENDDIFTLAYRGGTTAQLGETSQPDDEWLNTTSEDGTLKVEDYDEDIHVMETEKLKILGEIDKEDIMQ